MKTGLVSVTFRQLSPQEIIALVAQAGLEGIEWVGDVHVPPDDLANARAVGQATRHSGLAVACYGSYCRLTPAERAAGAFEKTVAAAKALGAPLIRVWAGGKGSADATGQDYEEIAENSRFLAQLAEAEGISIAFEYHGGTLTDTAASARRLLEETDHPRVGSLWQPPVDMPPDECLAGMQEIEPYIKNAHVFSWQGTKRLPLKAGQAAWRWYLGKLQALPGERYALLEFVADDEPDSFLRDAQILRSWLEKEEIV